VCGPEACDGGFVRATAGMRYSRATTVCNKSSPAGVSSEFRAGKGFPTASRSSTAAAKHSRKRFSYKFSLPWRGVMSIVFRSPAFEKRYYRSLSDEFRDILSRSTNPENVMYECFEKAPAKDPVSPNHVRRYENLHGRRHSDKVDRMSMATSLEVRPFSTTSSWSGSPACLWSGSCVVDTEIYPPQVGGTSRCTARSALSAEAGFAMRWCTGFGMN